MQTLSNLSPFLDNLRYFMVAAIGSAFYSLTIFRYRSSSTFYDEAKIGTGINWWQLSDWIRLYGGLGISGLLALTQLFATLGVLVGLNCYIWIIVGGFGGVTLFATISVMRFLGWEAGYKASTDTSSPSDQAKGVKLMSNIKFDTMYDAAMTAVSTMVLAGAAEGWYYAQWEAYTPEEQYEWIVEWQENIVDRAGEISAMRASMKVAEAEAEDEDAEAEAENVDADAEAEEATGEDDEEAPGEDGEDATA